jgi:zinc/manganese transport system permease protein
MLSALTGHLWFAPLVACVVIVLVHAYLGLHVIAREVIFVDLSLAPMAARGSTIAVLFGLEHDAPQAMAYSLGFTTLGAALFAVSRGRGSGRVPQEAIIGIVYVIASAATLLVADKSPRGGEAVKDILIGSLLWVGWNDIGWLSLVSAGAGLFHFAFRRQFCTISQEPDRAAAEGLKLRWWDFWFYLSFGVVITMSVPIVGVLLVFSFLVVPAAIAYQFATGWRPLTCIAWAAGALASAAGLAVSFRYDLPTGPVIVCVFGVLLVVAMTLRRRRLDIAA